MTTCGGCGVALTFRYIDGRCVPLGCRCYSGGGRSSGWQRRVDVGRPWSAGLGIVPWPVTYPTRCFWCGEEVFYHTNGYGDCVLFDELGPPWPIHECWLSHREERKRAIVTSTGVLVNFGVRNIHYVEWDRSIAASVPPDAWWRPSEKDSLSQWTRELPEQLVYLLDKPPNPPDLDCPGPFLLLSWVASHSDSLLASPLLPQKDSPWVGVVSGVRGLEIFVPVKLRKLLRVGDPLVAEIVALGGQPAPRYVVSRLRTASGGFVETEAAARIAALRSVRPTNPDEG